MREMSTWLFSKYHYETIQLSYDTTFLGPTENAEQREEKREQKQAGTD